ncbi:hypothetical protein SAMN05878276_1127 [Aquipseudomonas alcaligenes]|nr:hypothetical protein SAMN05878276_1127 [Pseudomonas alcaligenes]
MNNEFEQRLAVVTGASSGVGLAVCEQLLERGARVRSLALEHAREGMRLNLVAPAPAPMAVSSRMSCMGTSQESFRGVKRLYEFKSA